MDGCIRVSRVYRYVYRLPLVFFYGEPGHAHGLGLHTTKHMIDD